MSLAKSLKYTKITQKVTFPLTFVNWCKKQMWPKIQFYLLEHIFSTKFVHFPIDISDFFFEEFHQSSLWIKQKFRRILGKAWIIEHKTMKIPLPMLLWVIPYDWETKYTKKKLNYKKKIWWVFGRFCLVLSHCAAVH